MIAKTRTADEDPQDYPAQIAASQALLNHVYWVCSDLADRIESFNQRAGVILAASVGIFAVGLQSLLGTSWFLTVKLGLPWILPIGLALYTVTVKTSHDVGPAAIRPYVAATDGPDLQKGHWMTRELLNSLTQPAGDQPSVLEGLNSLCQKKALGLKLAQATLVLALLSSLISGAEWAVVNAITH